MVVLKYTTWRIRIYGIYFLKCKVNQALNTYWVQSAERNTLFIYRCYLYHIYVYYKPFVISIH